MFLNLFKNKNLYFVLATFVISLISFWYVLASAQTNIKNESGLAWSESGGWLNFASDDGGVMVYDDYLAGYIWSEKLGWISLNCANTNSCDFSNYKIINDKEGTLSGYAWGENIGWINFKPDNGGVKINSEGEFSGYAWGDSIGWLVFNCKSLDVCQNNDFKVATTWLPLSIQKENEMVGLEIYDVDISTTDTKAVIEWRTNNESDSHLRWGTDRNLDKEKDEDKKEKKHGMVIRNLDPETRYFFRIRSTDTDNQTDTSRIWDVSTKKSSSIFATRKWEQYDQEEKEQEDYEKVQIEIKDKVKDKKEEDNIDKSNQIPDVSPETQAEITTEDDEKESGLARISAVIKNGLGDLFLGFYEKLMSTQRSIAKLFKNTGEGISDRYNSFQLKFARKIDKDNSVSKEPKKESNLFTTLVFKKDDRKFLAEVKFQIIDNADNPIPKLHTTLFSDPQESITDDNGIASFKDVPVGNHTLVFNHQGKYFEKNVAIADTITDDGKVRAEIVKVWATKDKIAAWMWMVIAMLFVMITFSVILSIKYYKLKKEK